MRMKHRDVLGLVKRVNNFSLDFSNRDSYKPFRCDGIQIGLIVPEVQEALAQYPHVFMITDTEVTFNNKLRSFLERSEALKAVLLDLHAKDRFVSLRGWRNECYEICETFGSMPLFEIERAAAPILGLRKYGVHINGYVNHSLRGLCMWIQRRSPTKQTYPGKLDNFVGGGLTEGRGVLETALKEAAEEAGLSPQLAAGLKASGTISFLHESERGIHPQTEFVFDLELSEQFQPCNMDGEVAEWHLLPASEIVDLLCSEDFKITSVPVALDFLIRHGHLSVEQEPELPKLVEMLHVPLHSLF